MTPATCSCNSVIRQISNTYLALNNHSSIVATGSAYSCIRHHVCSAGPHVPRLSVLLNSSCVSMAPSCPRLATVLSYWDDIFNNPRGSTRNSGSSRRSIIGTRRYPALRIKLHASWVNIFPRGASTTVVPFCGHATHNRIAGALTRRQLIKSTGETLSALYPLYVRVSQCTSYLLTLGAHAQRGLQYLVCVSVCLSVCLSVCRRLFSHYRLRGGL